MPQNSFSPEWSGVSSAHFSPAACVIMDSSLGTSGRYRVMRQSDFSQLTLSGVTVNGEVVIENSIGLTGGFVNVSFLNGTGSPNVTVNGGTISVTGTPAVSVSNFPAAYSITGSPNVTVNGGTISVTGTPAVSVSNFPSLFGSTGAYATTSSNSTISGVNGTVFQTDTNRLMWSVTNVGTTVLYVKMGTSGDNTSFNFILKGGTVTGDGLGGLVTDDDAKYRGPVSVSGTAPYYMAWSLP